MNIKKLAFHLNADTATEQPNKITFKANAERAEHQRNDQQDELLFVGLLFLDWWKLLLETSAYRQPVGRDGGRPSFAEPPAKA